MSEMTTVDLWLLDGTYKLGCKSDKQDSLKNAGELLEQKFRDMRQANPRMDNQKVAVMVALQLMQEVVELNTTLQQYGQCEELLQEMLQDTEDKIKALN